MKTIELKKKNGIQTSKIMNTENVPYLQFDILEKTGIVKHGFSTRLGGVSKGIYTSMNLSFTRGDEHGDVLENYKRIANAIGFSYEDIVMSAQTHTTNIRVVTKEDKGKGIVKEKDYDNIDGLLTNERNIVLATFYADCVPLYFVDPVAHAIGLSHSGWKGTVNRIGKMTVEAMQKEFGSDPKDIVVCIAPSICQDCYEIGEDVANEFIKSFQQEQIDKFLKKKSKDKYHLDLWKANKFVLLEAGILQRNIALPDVCTCCNKEILYSHRGLQGKRGNLAAFLMLK